MLTLEAQRLQEVISECIQQKFGDIDVSNLVSDLAKMSTIFSQELRESLRAYMSQYAWHAPRPGR